MIKKNANAGGRFVKQQYISLVVFFSIVIVIVVNLIFFNWLILKLPVVIKWYARDYSMLKKNRNAEHHKIKYDENKNVCMENFQIHNCYIYIHTQRASLAKSMCSLVFLADCKEVECHILWLRGISDKEVYTWHTEKWMVE